MTITVPTIMQAPSADLGLATRKGILIASRNTQQRPNQKGCECQLTTAPVRSLPPYQ
jgi:hypothetical protein